MDNNWKPSEVKPTISIAACWQIEKKPTVSPETKASKLTPTAKLPPLGSVLHRHALARNAEGVEHCKRLNQRLFFVTIY